ncbi:MAG: archease, partial [Smithellaceae bacterium]|nr:archease [Smithellaceae bacterium]
MKYELFPHTADLGVVIHGSSLTELFSHGAFAVYDLMTDLRLVAPAGEMTIQAEGTDREDLLINYLREVLHLYHGLQFLPCDFDVLTLDETRVVATFKGETFNPDRHRIIREIKAATYCALAIRQISGGWEATVVF